MSIAITSSLPATSFTNPSTEAAPRPQPATNVPVDTVQLTEAQQVYQLYNQGQKISQIANSLNLAVETVNVYLGIKSSS
jgi:DNA-binding NarL/FixJ family response regulator